MFDKELTVSSSVTFLYFLFTLTYLLETMALLKGRDVEDLVKERLMQIIVEDITCGMGYYKGN